LRCSICGNWYCKNCFPKNRNYNSYWFDDSLINNPLELSKDSIKELLDSVCINCLKFSFKCDECKHNRDSKECVKCIIKSRIRIYDLAKIKLQQNLKKNKV